MFFNAYNTIYEIWDFIIMLSIENLYNLFKATQKITFRSI